MPENRKENEKTQQSPAITEESSKTPSSSRTEIKREISNVDNENFNTIFDLRTKNGQILFLLITIAISCLVQCLPNDALKSFFQTSNKDVSKTLPHLSSCPTVELTLPERRPSYWAYGRNIEGGHLKHVHLVLERLGYMRTNSNDTNDSDWDLLWAHDYPFRQLQTAMQKLKPHQKINHFPGCGFLTNKVDLATTNLKYIPKSFKLPAEADQLRKYAEKYPEKKFVQKHNQHRHIQIKSLNEIDFSNNDTFVQEFIDNPLLVDGHKFDIGVYTIITSIDPLRVYIYKGDILLRYCPVKYYPFDAKNVDKYIVGDDYLPTWEVPSLSQFYNGLGFGMKHSFDAYLRGKGRNPDVIWDQVEDAIRIAILNKESSLITATKRYKSMRNFFELMRFDLVVDDDLNVFLMEANMSPNLSSAHFPPNRLLYEQVLYHAFNMIGLGSVLHRESLRKRQTDMEIMISTDKNIAVNANLCSQLPCSDSCAPIECHTCRPCLSPDDLAELHAAYREHIHRGDTKRIFPVSIEKSMSISNDDLDSLSPKNRFMTKWFMGKCEMDSSWCS